MLFIHVNDLYQIHVQLFMHVVIFTKGMHSDDLTNMSGLLFYDETATCVSCSYEAFLPIRVQFISCVLGPFEFFFFFFFFKCNRTIGSRSIGHRVLSMSLKLSEN